MFIGREQEVHSLRNRPRNGRARLIAVYGRRRVGKTALIEHAFEKEAFWKFEGLEGGSSREQIRHFLHTLGTYTTISSQIAKSITTWQKALSALYEALPDKPITILFDEFQWMAGMRKPLVSIFKWAWDNYFSKQSHCQFVLCGSVSSFIVKKVIQSTALYGRIDLEINLKPLTVREMALLIGPLWTRADILEAYFVFGGIPQYALEMDTTKSLVQNIQQLGFTPNGFFVREFQRLFISHFGRNAGYARMLTSLSRKQTQSIEELAKAVKLSTGGTFTHLLEDLELAGFIHRSAPVDRKSKGRLLRIQLLDEFLFFYFTFIEKNLKSIDAGTIQPFSLLTGQPFDQWKGYAFERLCTRNAYDIARKLEFSGIQYHFGSFFRNNSAPGAQIDLVFIRADNVATVCEIKYVNRLSGSIIEEFETKLAVFSTYWKHGVQKVLVLGKKIAVPKAVTDYFNAILFAEDIFF